MEFKRAPPKPPFQSIHSFLFRFLLFFFFFKPRCFFFTATRLDHTTRSSIRASREQRPQRDYRGEPAVRRFQFVTEPRSLQIIHPLPTPSPFYPFAAWSRNLVTRNTDDVYERYPPHRPLAVTLASYSRRPATIMLLVVTRRISATRSGKTLTFCIKLN